MAARKQQEHPEVVKQIMAGDFDADIALIQSACQARMKNMFRKGAKVRLHGTKNPELEGKVGTVVKVNSKRVTVGVGESIIEGPGTPWAFTSYEKGEYNVPPQMLEVVV